MSERIDQSEDNVEKPKTDDDNDVASKDLYDGNCRTAATVNGGNSVVKEIGQNGDFCVPAVTLTICGFLNRKTSCLCGALF